MYLIIWWRIYIKISAHTIYSWCISGLVELQPGPALLLRAGETDRVIGNLHWTEKDNHGLRYCDFILFGGCW